LESRVEQLQAELQVAEVRQQIARRSITPPIKRKKAAKI